MAHHIIREYLAEGDENGVVRELYDFDYRNCIEHHVIGQSVSSLEVYANLLRIVNSAKFDHASLLDAIL